MNKRNRAVALGAMWGVVGMGCLVQREPEPEQPCWKWELEYADGVRPVWAEVDVWSSGTWQGGLTGLGADAFLGTVTTSDGAGSWEGTPQGIRLSVRTQHPNGQVQQRSDIRLEACGSHDVALPTPTALLLHVPKPGLEWVRLHALLAESPAPPDLASWIAQGPSEGAAVVNGAAIEPILVAFDFPIGVEAWPVHVQWYGQRASGELVPLCTHSHLVDREFAGDTLVVSTLI